MLVLDEPSTALSCRDVDRLFVFLRKLKAEGVAIIYVSHRMDEIARIADRATILRDGRHVITAPLSELPIDTMIEHIVGKRSRGLSDVGAAIHAIGRAAAGAAATSPAPHKPERRRPDAASRRGASALPACSAPAARRWRASSAASSPHRAGRDPHRRASRSRSASPSDAIAAGVALMPEDRVRRRASSPRIRSPPTSSLAVLDRLRQRRLRRHAKRSRA